MKIMMINSTGNVGKTTITREVIAGNLKECAVLEIDTSNSGNKKFSDKFFSYARHSGQELEEIYSYLNIHENIAIDIGSSNIVDFLREASELEGLLEMIDIFIVPTTHNMKQMQDTLATVKTLINGLDIAPEKIYAIASLVNNKKTIDEDFKVLFGTAKKLGFSANKELSIIQTKTINDAEKEGKRIFDIVNDGIDYKALMKEAREKGDIEKVKEYSKIDLLKMRAKNVTQDFTRIFNLIVRGAIKC
jgi:uncharacterized protein (UPF0335 family)